MTPIIKQLEAALIAAGHVKADGSVNLYSAEQAGVCGNSTLSRILRGERSPSVEFVDLMLGRIGRRLVVQKKTQS